MSESTMRVLYFDAPLIAGFRKARDKAEAINRDWLSQAVRSHLPAITRELRAVGLSAPGERRPVRLELTLDTLADLADASEATTIPAQTLLGLCLARASKPQRRSRK